MEFRRVLFRSIAMILQRLHPRQQCSSAVVTRKYRMSAAFEPGAPSGDSPDDQGTSGLRPGYPRSAARGVGKEGVRTGRSRWSPDDEKKKHAKLAVVNTNMKRRC